VCVRVHRCFVVLFLGIAISFGVFSQTARTASLTVVSRPAGATITFDGREIGTTPKTIERIVPGRHRILVELAGYTPYEEWILFSSGDEIEREIDLRVPTGVLRIVPPEDVDPGTLVVTAGSTLYSGTTLELPAGTYTVVVRAFGYEPITRTVSVSSDAVSTVPVSFQPVAVALEESGLLSSVISPRNPPPFDRAILMFRGNAPAEYEVQVLDSDGTALFYTLGSISDPQPVPIEWIPPPTTEESTYRFRLVLHGEGSTISRRYDLRVTPFATVAPRIPSVAGRGGTLVRIPSGSDDTRSLAFGSGYIPAQGTRSGELPVIGAFSFFPVPRWETTIAARASADDSGDTWSGIAALTLSTPSLYTTNAGSIRMATKFDLHGTIGTGDPAPWRRNTIAVGAPTSVETATGFLGVSIDPGVYGQFDDPEDPTIGAYGGTAIYLQTSRLLLSASARIDREFSGDTLLSYGVDSMLRVSTLPAYLTLGILLWDDDPRIGINSSLVIFR